MEIKVGKHAARIDGKEGEAFTMTLGGETIDLLPYKNWSQLDLYKWRARGRLPGTPAGLEIAPDHIKLTGETVSIKDTDGCARLERLFAEWLALEREGLEQARRKAQAKATALVASGAVSESQRRFEVELDKKGQVHVHCVQGKEKVATIGLNVAGFQSLVSQGWLRKPHALKTGVLHDWVELDGVLYSFEKGNNDAARLALVLNGSYLPSSSLGQGKDVVVFANAASSTGFDIQFPAKVGGVPDNRRRPLDEAALELLQDPDRCGLLPAGLVIKLTRPTIIFKRKTDDGGERYLDAGPDTLVRVIGEGGEDKLVDLSHPINYLRLSAVELTAIFNHPAVNRHGQLPGAAASEHRTPETPPVRSPEPAHSSQMAPNSKLTNSSSSASQDHIRVAERAHPQAAAPKPSLPNRWLNTALTAQPIRYDWLTCLVYSKIASTIGNSRETRLWDEPCWMIDLCDANEPPAPDGKGIFLTDKGGFGFVHAGHAARFEQGAFWVGTQQSRVEVGSVRLAAVGRDASGAFVFIVGEDCRSKLLAADLAEEELIRLKAAGATVVSVKEAIEGPVPLETVWTVPAEQRNPADPQAVEHHRAA